mmetsp:Transcript_17547/g.29609  ORF Transcript_17547/g.29609 Transcript_17547/m.29609 type:complete len:115 (-) Transcript_17547:100-444(-)|eukprot:CAMPEP_0168617546 /NCGR_PEP_ID=MMETSP0449_2-20121227/5597_1 /TAXON_ID=1082188 /ORGANISM="Strombidium rassoulzadegani, Strain ras09" /LENGTH=114 /DNA_ID=CAMNT_0008658363 /DNA_START=258 /DNA_END=602 /DNA_ORIENTATION=+
MGALRSCCGIYCAFTALVGVYFFVILAIMQYRENSSLVQVYAKDDEPKDRDDLRKMRGASFLVLAVVQIVLVIGCALCGNQSIQEDKNEEEREQREAEAKYQRVQMEDNQIRSN